MTKSNLFKLRTTALIIFATLLFAPLASLAQTLYNGNLGTKPEAQGWAYAVLGSATETLTANTVMLDTTAFSATEAGWEASGNVLNRAAGLTLQFTVKLNSETHTSTNRSGFSVIVLGSDTNGIELGFWTDTIFALSDVPSFVHAEDASFTTTGSLVNYGLTLLATNYILTANGTTILSGLIRNYSASGAPYSAPNLLFFGDNTTSASASFNWGNATLVLPPALAISSPGVISWSGVTNELYIVQSSTNLTNWSVAGTSTSSTTSYGFTNTAPNSRQFFRVVAP